MTRQGTPRAAIIASMDEVVIMPSTTVGRSRLMIRRRRQTRRILLNTALSPPVLEDAVRSEEHTSELQSLMRISYAVFCLKKKKKKQLNKRFSRIATNNYKHKN